MLASMWLHGGYVGGGLSSARHCRSCEQIAAHAHEGGRTPMLALSIAMPKPAPIAGSAVTMMVASRVSMKNAAAKVKAMREDVVLVELSFSCALPFMSTVSPGSLPGASSRFRAMSW